MAVSMSNLLSFSSQLTTVPRLVSMQIQRSYSIFHSSFMHAPAIRLQHPSLRHFSSLPHLPSGIDLQKRVRVVSDPTQWIRPKSLYRFETPEVCKVQASSTAKESFSKPSLVFAFLGAICLVACKKEAKAEEPVDDKFERMYALLHKPPHFRTVDERIELFNYLLKKGEEEVSKAKNKHVVIVFGPTGGGKSTLINFLSGCQMKREGDQIIVDPQSPIKEVAKIGPTLDSCTFIPRETSTISVSFVNEALVAEDGTPLSKERVLTIYDTPGFEDTRGIEVALANVIVAKKLFKNAVSARLVMVVEKSVLTAEKGRGWKEAVQLLEDTFNKNVGLREKSLCVIVTKSKNLDQVNRNIRQYTPTGSLNLIPYTQIYDPLNPQDRNLLLEVIDKVQAHPDLDSQITMSGKQLWDAWKLGEEVSKAVIEHVEKGDEREIDKAIKKVQFTYGFTILDNDDLKKPHKEVKDALEKYVANYIEDMDPKNHPFQTQIESFRNYKRFREKFKDFVEFYPSDKKVRKHIQETSDPRRFAFDTPKYTVTGVVSTTAFLALACLNPWFLLGAAGAGALTGVAGDYYRNPSQEDKDRSEFAAGI
jgi:energy-coupling factor transporter ATP-binding protein EcfA2